MHKKVRLGFQGCTDTWVNSSLGIVLVSAVAGVDKSLLAAIYDGKQDWGRVNPVFFQVGSLASFAAGILLYVQQIFSINISRGKYMVLAVYRAIV